MDRKQRTREQETKNRAQKVLMPQKKVRFSGLVQMLLI